jgi:Flp pilus assembly secretin CpaC
MLFSCRLSAQEHNCEHNFEHKQIENCSISIPSVVRVFPNPTADIFQITGLKAQNTEGVLFDAQGRIIRVIMLQNGKEINISDLSATIYFLKIPHQPILKIIKL